MSCSAGSGRDLPASTCPARACAGRVTTSLPTICPATQLRRKICDSTHGSDTLNKLVPERSWVQAQMAPSEQVMAEALALRRSHLQQLGSLLRRRIEVNQYTVGTLGRSDTTQGSASSHASKLLQVLPSGL